MNIDEDARVAAVDALMARGFAWTHSTDLVRWVLDAYLAALPAEPEIEGGVRVRVCVAVGKSGGAFWSGGNGCNDCELREMTASLALAMPVQFRWIEATVPPYALPAEPAVEGRVAVDREENGDEVRG